MLNKTYTTQQQNTDLPGSIIPGYSVLAKLGRGGMGSVFKAIQLSMNRLVALKFLPVNLAKDRSYIRRFLREARSAALLNHPNITRVYEVGNYKGLFYFSMEYIDGTTLLNLIESKCGLDIETAIDIIIQAARGLEHAHSHRIIHRDIKPENIMIANDGTVKICDMGLAKRMDLPEHDITVTGQVIGTPCYMSPEQIASPKSLDHRSDIYSLGATFYHVVTGERPFLGATSAQTMLNVVREPLKFPKNTKAPVQIIRVIKKMMAKDPAKRYQTAGELISELMLIRETLYSQARSRRLYAAAHNEPQNLLLPLVAAETLEKRSRLPWLLSAVALLVVLTVVIWKAIYIPSSALQEYPVMEISIPPREASAEEHLKAGIALASASHWEEALSEFIISSEIDPTIPAAWNNKGTALFSLGRLPEALLAFNEAIRLSPEDPETHRNRGAVLLSMKKYEEALSEFETSISLSPENAAAWNAKAVCLKDMGRIAESVEAFRQAQELTPR